MTRTSPGRIFRAGWYFGLGFAIPYCATLVLIAAINIVRQDRMLAVPSSKPFSDDAKVVVASHDLRRPPGNAVVVGTVSNQGSDSWWAVRLQVDLFDTSGTLVWVCSGTLAGNLRPGGNSSFLVDCDHSAEDALPEFATYKVMVAGANYERPPTHN